LQEAKEDVYPAPLANSAITSFVNSLAHSLLTDEQQQQVKTILELWKACRYAQGGQVIGSVEEPQLGQEESCSLAADSLYSSMTIR